jgi:hypothetical protein
MTLWFEAPMVVAARMGPLALFSADAAKAQAEMTRMVTEKMAAAAESLIALQFAMVQETMRASMRLAPISEAGAAHAAASRVVASSLRPYGRRVRANARRLRPLKGL